MERLNLKFYRPHSLQGIWFCPEVVLFIKKFPAKFFLLQNSRTRVSLITLQNVKLSLFSYKFTKIFAIHSGVGGIQIRYD